MDRRPHAADGASARRADRRRPALGRLGARRPSRPAAQGPWALLRPALLARRRAVAWSSSASTTSSCPATNAPSSGRWPGSRRPRSSTSSRPRTFREPRPGILFFFDRADPDNRSFEGVFLKLGDEGEPPNRVIVARRGDLTLEEDRLWLDLHDSTVHEIDPQDPSRYRTTRNASQRLLLAGEWRRTARGTASRRRRASGRSRCPSSRRGARSTPAPIRGGARSPDRDAQEARHPVRLLRLRPRRRAARAVAAPRRARQRLRDLARNPRRVLRASLERRDLVRRGPAAAGPRDVDSRTSRSSALGVAATLCRAERRGRALPRPLAEAAAAFRRTRPPHAHGARDAARRAAAAAALPRRPVRARPFPDLGPRPRPRVGASDLLVVDYADKLDEVARHHPSADGGARLLPLLPALDHDPDRPVRRPAREPSPASASCRRTTRTRRSAPPACRCLRLALPVFVAAVVAAALCFTVGEYILPFAEQQEARYKNEIYGLPPDTGVRDHGRAQLVPVRPRRDLAPGGGELRTSTQLFGVSIFRFSAVLRAGRPHARRGRPSWTDGAWRLTARLDARSSGARAASRIGAFAEETVPGDPPRALAAVRRRPEEMRFRELERLTRRLRRRGLRDGRPRDGPAVEARPARPAAGDGAARGALRLPRRQARNARRNRRRARPRDRRAGRQGLRDQARRGGSPASPARGLGAERSVRARRDLLPARMRS